MVKYHLLDINVTSEKMGGKNEIQTFHWTFPK